MPHIDINLYPGRTDEVKQDMAQKLVDFFVKELNFPVESLSVSFSEFKAENFAKEVMRKIDAKDVCIDSKFLK